MVKLHREWSARSLFRLLKRLPAGEFDPWFRGLSWESYRQFAPRTVSLARAVAAKRLAQILLAVEFLEGLDQPVLKWSLPDNSHVCLVSDTVDQVSRDMAVSNLTALIARDEYVLEESYSGEEEEDEEREGRSEDSDTETEISRLRERKEVLEKARKTEQARARRAQREILNEVVSVCLHIRPRTLVLDTNILVTSSWQQFYTFCLSSVLTLIPCLLCLLPPASCLLPRWTTFLP